MAEAGLGSVVIQRIKKYLKWYVYPVVYFLVTSLVCLFAWYRSAVNHREGIKVIFKTISVVPALVWSGIITLWILAVISFVVLRYWIKKSNPSQAVAGVPADCQGRVEKGQIVESEIGPKSGWRKIADRFSYVLGIVLIFVGLTLGIWIARPYITLLLSSSRIEALEREVESGHIKGNRIIIPSILVDAPILEGVSKEQLSKGVCHLSGSPLPGQGGNYIVEGHNLAEFGIWESKSFFSLLDVVSEGAPIYVFRNGKKYTYKVKAKTYRDVNDPKLFAVPAGEHLTLLTCVSTWSPTIYTSKRTVVIADPQF
jgi:LPXTG-site transpeptidase (sortase) family protein